MVRVAVQPTVLGLGFRDTEMKLTQAETSILDLFRQSLNTLSIKQEQKEK